MMMAVEVFEELEMEALSLQELVGIGRRGLVIQGLVWIGETGVLGSLPQLRIPYPYLVKVSVEESFFGVGVEV